MTDKTKRRSAPSLSLPTLALVAAICVLGVFVFYPIIFTIDGSFWSSQPGFPGYYTLSNYVSLFGSLQTYVTVMNTVVFSGGSAAIAIGLGTALSVITVRTDTPFRQVLFYLPYFPLAFPVLIANQAWIYLFSVRSGLLNLVCADLGLSNVTFNIYSWPGFIFASAMALTPIAYVTISSGMRSMDTSLEEASRASGAGVLDTLRRVSIPLMAPSIFSAFLLCFTISAGSFETATMIGLPAKIMVMMSSVYRNVDQVTPPDYRAAAAESALLLAIIMVMVYIYNRSLRRSRKFEVISGKGYSRGRVLSLGRWRWVAFALISGYLVLALALPLFTIVLLSLVPIWNPGNLFGRLSLANFKFLLSDSSGALFALHNSLLASVAAATIVLGVALVIVFAARRTNIPGRGILEGIGMLPISMPALVLSFGLLWAFLTLPLGLYGTLGVMVIALSVSLLPQGIRSISGGVIQVQSELQEAARTSGAGVGTTIWRIFLPLVRPSVVGAWLYVFIGSFNALGAVLLLQSTNNQLFSTLLWSWYTSSNLGNTQSFAAGCVLLFVILVAAVTSMVVVQRILERNMSLSRR